MYYMFSIGLASYQQILKVAVLDMKKWYGAIPNLEFGTPHIVIRIKTQHLNMQDGPPVGFISQTKG